MNMNDEICGYITSLNWDDLSDAIRQRIRYIVLDIAGAAAGGLGQQAVPQAYRVLSAGGNTSMFDRANLLGTMAQAADLDETNLPARCHIAAAVVPALAAALQHSRVSGAEFLASVAVGYGVEAALGRATAPRHGAHGWHPSSTVGTFGAAAACARLLRLDRDGASRALAIAGTHAAGVKTNFGGSAKPFNLGRAASTGLLSARMAAEGVSVGSASFDQANGFFGVAGCGPLQIGLPDASAVLDNHFKFFPYCIETHAPALALRTLIERNGSCPDEIRVSMARGALDVVDNPHPASLEQARLSVQYVLSLVATGNLALTPRAFDPSSLASLPKTTIVEAPVGHLEAKVEARWNGRTDTMGVDLGDAGAFEPDALEAKFDELARPLFGEETASVRARLLNIETCDNAAEVLEPFWDILIREVTRASSRTAA